MLSPPCNGSGARGLWQREEESIGVDAHALFGPAAAGQQGEKEAHCASRSALPFPTWEVLLGLPKNYLTASGSG